MPPIQKNYFDSDSDEEVEIESNADRSIITEQTRNNTTDGGRQSSVQAAAGGNYDETDSGRASSVFDRYGGGIGGGGMDLDFDDSIRGREESLSLDDILGTGTAEEEETNAKKMLRALSNEIGAPELLPFPRELVERFVKDLATRKALLRERSTQEGKSDAYYVANAVGATETMRASHILKEFTRQRIYKIEQFAQYYLSDLEDARQRMYDNELSHAQGYVEITEKYMRSAVLDSMPNQIERLDEPYMIAVPDWSKAVFLRVRKNCGPVVLPDGAILQFDAGDHHLCRYSSIRELLREGMIELI